jgi:plastocyanin
MKKLLLASIGLSALVLWAVSCGGGGGYGGGTPTPTAPSQTTTPPTNTPPAQATATVNIVASAGSGAFTPNPVQVPSGGTIRWTNSTANAHVLVMNDGRSIGTLAPGASMTTTVGAGGDYRCTTHPSMVGSINGASAPKPPDDGYDDDGYLAPPISRSAK